MRYFFWHIRTVESEDDERLTGVYTSEALAKAAIDRISAKAGFCDSPEGFEICPYKLNQDYWIDGFDSRSGLPAWFVKRHH